MNLNNSTDTMKSAWDSIWNTEMEERINELEERNLLMLQVEEERAKISKIVKKHYVQYQIH